MSLKILIIIIIIIIIIIKSLMRMSRSHVSVTYFFYYYFFNSYILVVFGLAILERQKLNFFESDKYYCHKRQTGCLIN